MLQNLKTIPRKLANRRLAIVVREAVVNVWAANMNVLHVARIEGLRVFNAVTQRTEIIRNRNVKALKITAEAANEKLSEGWTAVEKVLDARVIPVFGKMGLGAPVQFGVDLVDKGVARVSAKVIELTRERKAPVRKTAAKKMPSRKAVTKRVATSKLRKAA